MKTELRVVTMKCSALVSQTCINSARKTDEFQKGAPCSHAEVARTYLAPDKVNLGQLTSECLGPCIRANPLCRKGLACVRVGRSGRPVQCCLGYLW